VGVHRLLLVPILLLALAVPASAAELDPSTLVLRQADVPTGFDVDAGRTGLRSNAAEAKGEPRFVSLLARWGRVTGYEVAFERRTASISSRADVLRTREGANMMLDWVALEVRKSGILRLQRVRTNVGDEAVLYRSSRGGVAFAIVVWRSGRVFAGVATTEISSKQALALARLQQRRIAAARR
jgi:hypothetical protein